MPGLHLSVPPLSSPRLSRLLISCSSRCGVIWQFWFGYRTRESASTAHSMYRADVVAELFDHARAADNVDTVNLTSACQLSRYSLARYSAQTVTESVLCPEKHLMSLYCWSSVVSLEVCPAVGFLLLTALLHLLPHRVSLT